MIQESGYIPKESKVYDITLSSAHNYIDVKLIPKQNFSDTTKVIDLIEIMELIFSAGLVGEVRGRIKEFIKKNKLSDGSKYFPDLTPTGKLKHINLNQINFKEIFTSGETPMQLNQ